MADVLEEIYAALNSNELKHHGVKGMKWGVRRDRSSGSSRPSNPSASRPTKVPNTFKNKPQNRRMSDAELRNRINRLNLEKQYADLTRPPERGKSFVRKALEEAGQRAMKNLANKAADAAVQTVLNVAADKATGGTKTFLEAMAAANGSKKGKNKNEDSKKESEGESESNSGTKRNSDSSPRSDSKAKPQAKSQRPSGSKKSDWTRPKRTRPAENIVQDLYQVFENRGAPAPNFNIPFNQISSSPRLLELTRG